MNPPSVRQQDIQSPNRTTARRLDNLPNELILQILHKVCAKQPRQKSDVESLFSMALTNSKLYTISKDIVEGIDELPPSFLRSPAFKILHSAPYNFEEEEVYSLANFSKTRLKVLKFCFTKEMEELLKNVWTGFFPNLEELSIMYDPSIEEFDDSEWHIASLKTLTIYKPTTHLIRKLSGSDGKIEHVSFLSTRMAEIYRLETYFFRKGHFIRSMTLGSDKHKWNTTCASFIVTCIQRYLPLLRSLTFNAVPEWNNSSLRNHTVMSQNQRPVTEYLVYTVRHKIKIYREEVTTEKVNVKKIVIRAAARDILKFLECFRPLISADVEVEVDILGMCMVFPVNSSENKKPYLKSLCVEYTEFLKGNLYGKPHTQLESLALGTTEFLCKYKNNEEIKMRVINIAEKSSQSITRLQSVFQLTNVPMYASASAYLQDMLSILPNIEFLEISFDLILYMRGKGDKSQDRMLNVLNLCKNVRQIHISSTRHPLFYSVLPYLEVATPAEVILMNLTFFTSMLIETCPKLEGFFMDSHPFYVPAEYETRVRDIAKQTIFVLESFEDLRPAVDLKTVKKTIRPLCHVEN